MSNLLLVYQLYCWSIQETELENSFNSYIFLWKYIYITWELILEFQTNVQNQIKDFSHFLEEADNDKAKLISDLYLLSNLLRDKS